MTVIYFASISALLIGLTSALSTGPQCEWPPSVWCSSQEIAKACHAEKACFEHAWRRPSNALKTGVFPRVRIGLLYESLCPDCQAFIQNQLYKAFQEVGGIVNFTLIPFGNAREAWNETKHRWDFTCQHGKRECIGNIIETCAINLYPDQDVHLKFIYCVESAKKFPDEIFETCASKSKMDAQKIHNCYTSKTGNTYEHEMALRTPKHSYVPWVSLNGVHTEEIQDQASTDLVKLICDAYVGTKPPGCRNRRKPCQNN